MSVSHFFHEAGKWLAEDHGRLVGLSVVVLFLLQQLILVVSRCRARRSFAAALREGNGRHVFITGGSQGLGLALAHKVLEMGASVTIVARREVSVVAAAARAAVLLR